MLIEAAKGGHTNVVQLLLDYPHSIMMSPPHSGATGGLHEVPEAVRVLPPDEVPFTAKPTITSAGQSLLVIYWFTR